VGMIGHVAHGKSTLVRRITGIKTQKFGAEEERNITIRLGYANAKIWKCNNTECAPYCYAPSGSAVREVTCKNCGSTMQLIRHISFVDCPGHDVLISTMLNGSAVMDSAILVIAGNEGPRTQTAEHLVAAEMMNLQNLICVQTKIDLVDRDQCMDSYEKIKSFVKDSIAESAPVIPLCGQKEHNIDALLSKLVGLPVPKRNTTASPRMLVIRSFDVNKPGEEIDNLKGGVAGGTLLRGILKIGQEIELRPGIVRQTSNGALTCSPIISKIISLASEGNHLDYAVPGGLIGVGTQIDPSLAKSDRLVGQLLGAKGALPDVYIDLDIDFSLMSLAVGDKTEAKINKLKKDELLNLNIGATTAKAKVTAVKGHTFSALLQTPVCVDIGDKVSISKQVVDKNWRIIGCGNISGGKPMPLY